MFYTYILKMNDGRFYTGITNDLARRISEHEIGRSKSTRRFLPVKLIKKFEFETRQLARIMEVKIKNRGAKHYIDL